MRSYVHPSQHSEIKLLTRPLYEAGRYHGKCVGMDTSAPVCSLCRYLTSDVHSTWPLRATFRPRSGSKATSCLHPHLWQASSLIFEPLYLSNHQSHRALSEWEPYQARWGIHSLKMVVSGDACYPRKYILVHSPVLATRSSIGCCDDGDVAAIVTDQLSVRSGEGCRFLSPHQFQDLYGCLTMGMQLRILLSLKQWHLTSHLVVPMLSLSP